MLASVCRFIVPKTLIDGTRQALNDAGKDGFELFALWSGMVDHADARVLTMHVPEQISYKTLHGLVVRVEGPALHKLNVWLFENEETLLAQVHAHPTTAFHSDTDDKYPMVTSLGGLSIVVPDFAEGGLLTKGTRIYRLTMSGWDGVPPKRAKRLIEVTD